MKQTSITEAVSLFLKENNIGNQTVLAAVSGGADSSVMLHILNSLKGAFNLDLKVIHLNHNWRGEDSKKDFEFVKNTAESYGCEFYGEILEDDVKKTELDAREARYSFFEGALKKFKADVCFLAHNKNDNVETLIYRIIKGTGISGLSSVPKVRKPYYRPLLDFSRAEIESYAAKNGIEFRHDKSNDDAKYKRNHIRKNILPSMEKVNANVLDSISSLIGLAVENNEIIEDYINGLRDKIFDKQNSCWAYGRPTIKRKAFLGLSDALQREILSRYFKGILKNRDYKNILKIQTFISENENSTLSINADTFLKVWNDNVFLYKREGEK